MKKHNLLDTTFIIPVRIDTIDRLENLIACTKHILKSFNTNIIVIDGDMRNKKILKYLLNKKIQYIYCEDSDNVFYRTYYINKVVSKIQSTYLAIWDTDIIAPIEQIIESVNVLRHGNADFVLPYNGFALNVPICVKNIYFRHNSNIRILEKFKEGMHFMYGAK